MTKAMVKAMTAVRYNVILLAAALMLGVSCREDGLVWDDGALRTGTFTAVTESYDAAATRTSLDSEGDVLWKAGDAVSIFKGTTVNKKYQVTDSSDGKTSAEFNSVGDSSGGFYAGDDLSANVAYYPYSEAIDIRKADSGYALKVVLPSVQEYAADSFGNGAFPMAAVTSGTGDYSLKFKNVLGGLRLQIAGEGTVRRITVSGNGGEVLCGAGTVAVGSGSLPSISLTEADSTSVTLDCGEEGVALDPSIAKTFIIALPPVTMEDGFSIAITNLNGFTSYFYSTKSQAIHRSKLLKMPEIYSRDYQFPGPCPPKAPEYHTFTVHRAEFSSCCVAGFSSPQYRDPHSDADSLVVTWKQLNEDVFDALDVSCETFIENYDLDNIYVLKVDGRDSTLVRVSGYSFPEGITYSEALSGSGEHITSSDIFALYVDRGAASSSAADSVEFVLEPKSGLSGYPYVGFKFVYSITDEHHHDLAVPSGLTLNSDYMLGAMNVPVEAMPPSGYKPSDDAYAKYAGIATIGRLSDDGISYWAYIVDALEGYGSDVKLADDAVLTFEIVHSSADGDYLVGYGDDDVKFVSTDGTESDALTFTAEEFASMVETWKVSPYLLKYKGSFPGGSSVDVLVRVTEKCASDESLSGTGYFYVRFKPLFELAIENDQIQLGTFRAVADTAYVPTSISVVEYGTDNAVYNYRDGRMVATDYGKSFWGLKDQPATISFKKGAALSYPYGASDAEVSFGNCLYYGFDDTGLYVIWNNMGTDLQCDKFARYNITVNVGDIFSLDGSGSIVVLSSQNTKKYDFDNPTTINMPEMTESDGTVDGTPVTSISYAEQDKKITLHVGEPYQICVEVTPANTTENVDCRFGPGYYRYASITETHETGSPYWYFTINPSIKTDSYSLYYPVFIESDTYSTIFFTRILAADESE